MNSFFCASLLKNDLDKNGEMLSRHSRPARTEQLGLSNVSFLYQYVNTPPVAYGSPAPKIAESVLRSLSYNHLPDQGLGGLEEDGIPRQFWLPSDGDFPFNKTSGNFYLPAANDMTKAFLIENQESIDDTSAAIWEWLISTNSDILTKGRQTWDSINQRSVPAPEAFKIMYEFLQDNTTKLGTTLYTFLEASVELLDTERISYKQKISSQVDTKVFDKKTKMVVKKKKTIVRTQKITLTGNSAKLKAEDLATSFCGYLKSKERGKAKRRAICSANVIMRAFLTTIEEFHLRLAKKTAGNTISIGSEEKKKKILETLNSLTNFHEGVSCYATEDATKWNECLSPEGFALMHEIFFDNKIRQQLGLPLCADYCEVLKEIMVTGCYLLSRKKIFLGMGHVCEDEQFTSRYSWDESCEEKMNENTKIWYNKAKPYIEEEYLRAPYGMLMGMLNAGSTTWALMAVGQNIDVCTQSVRCNRSSDDSLTAFAATGSSQMEKLVAINSKAHKMLGVNISPKNTRYFNSGFGEYTSWYVDMGDFVSQYGVETASLRPGGTNAMDDFHDMAIGTQVSLREGKINFVGGCMRITLGVENVRRLWRIVRGQHNRTGVSPEVILLADGGNNPWDVTNCNLLEMCLRKQKASSEHDINYLDRVMNPSNPFSSDVMDGVTYSVELGTLIEKDFDTPRTVFNYLRRSNATMRDSDRMEKVFDSKAHHLASNAFLSTMPAASLLKEVGKRLMSTSIAENILIYREMLTEGSLSAADKLTIDQALEVLRRDPESWIEEDDLI